MTQDRSRKFSIDGHNMKFNDINNNHVQTLSTFSNQHTTTSNNNHHHHNLSNTPSNNENYNTPLINIPPNKKQFRNSISGTIPNQNPLFKGNSITNENHIFTYDHFDRVFNPKPKKKVKHNPFEITEDDKIFNELQTKKKIKKIKKPKLLLSRNEQILSQVYQLSKKSHNDIAKAKLKKKVLPLKQYQSHLLTIASLHLSKDSVKNLGKKFCRIRNICNEGIYEYNYDSLKELEEYEEQLILQMEHHEAALRNIILIANKEDGDKTFGVKLLNLPKVKFTKVIK